MQRALANNQHEVGLRSQAMLHWVHLRGQLKWGAARGAVNPNRASRGPGPAMSPNASQTSTVHAGSSDRGDIGRQRRAALHIDAGELEDATHGHVVAEVPLRRRARRARRPELRRGVGLADADAAQRPRREEDEVDRLEPRRPPGGWATERRRPRRREPVDVAEHELVRDRLLHELHVRGPRVAEGLLQPALAQELAHGRVARGVEVPGEDHAALLGRQAPAPLVEGQPLQRAPRLAHACGGLTRRAL
mmetsp:Transcript_17618/g.49594  ORF Transcript_17618/g.49594 Transcript_17618/m.49594 type:complete len:248 (-) Transcript_17618:558-1301(-)